MSGTARSHTRLRQTPQGAAQLDRRGRIRSYRPLIKQLDALAAEAERQRRAAERAERARDESPEQARVRRQQERTAGPAPVPSEPPPVPTGPSRAEVDALVDRMIADPIGGVNEVSGVLWQRYAADRPTAKARDRAMAEVTALVCDAWQARLGG